MLKVVILAGGEGRRLRPYTTILPKPLMPLGNYPVLEHIVKQLVAQNFKEIIVSVGYLSGLIEAYFGDGSKYGANITYLREKTPLGTVGPLKLLPEQTNSILVLNGDILTDLNYSQLINFHVESTASITVSTFSKDVQTNLGILDINEENEITAYTEKPKLNYQVSMGVYCCTPEVIRLIPHKRFNLPDLVHLLLKAQKTVKAFQHDGFWLDIGRYEDYEKALDTFEKS